MGIIVGLLSSGIGLAIEAATEYQAAKSTGNKTNPHSQYNSNNGSQDGYFDDPQAERDAKTFQELQSYVEFQRNLSNRVQDDILRDKKYTPVNAQMVPLGEGSGGYFSHKPYIHPSLEQSNTPGRLQCPVVIPQTPPDDKVRGWVRAYAPALMDCGIDQYTFLNFLNAFNESNKSSPYLDAVNVAGFDVGFGPGITPMLMSMAVPVAVRIARNTQAEKKMPSFLTRVNHELFVPHGLFAFVITYKPTSMSQVNTVDISQPTSYVHTSPSDDCFELPTAASLIFPEAKPTPRSAQQNKFKQIGHLIADYGDRQAQARYGFEHAEASLTTPLRAFRSRWGDHNSSSKSGGISSLITGRPGRDDKRRSRKDRRRKSISDSMHPREEEEQKPGLTSGEGGDGEGRNDTGFIRRLKGMGMKKDALYLVIVNNPTNDIESAHFHDSPGTVSSTSYPYQEIMRTKPPDVLEPDPFQQRAMCSPDSRTEYLTKVRYPQSTGYQTAPSRERSPPPAYESSRRGTRENIQFENGGRVEDYWSPTS